MQTITDDRMAAPNQYIYNTTINLWFRKHYGIGKIIRDREQEFWKLHHEISNIWLPNKTLTMTIPTNTPECIENKKSQNVLSLDEEL